MTARPAARTALASLGLTACGSGSSDTTVAASESSTALSHVHGLDVDPADERVYVATHNGCRRSRPVTQRTATATDAESGHGTSASL
ncbi:hypothetical protein [Streptomyces canus]|uniref:hypothetical protein n=1 Tax=Streptomyces canus TaxID=58343 RepID=UPI0033ACB782